jgi:hypothetical protein
VVKRTSVFLVAAAGVSLALMFRAGHRNPSVVLLAMFTAWVVSPFVALLVATARVAAPASRRDAIVTAAAWIVALGSPFLYAWDAVWPLAPKPAFLYLVVPSVSWGLIVVAGVVRWRRR